MTEDSSTRYIRQTGSIGNAVRPARRASPSAKGNLGRRRRRHCLRGQARRGRRAGGQGPTYAWIDTKQESSRAEQQYVGVLTRAQTPVAASCFNRLITGLPGHDIPQEVRSLGSTLKRCRRQILASHTALAANGPTGSINNPIKQISAIVSRPDGSATTRIRVTPRDSLRCVRLHPGLRLLRL